MRRGRTARGERYWIAHLVLAALGALVLAALVRSTGLAAIRGVLTDVRPGWLAVFAAIDAAIFFGFALRWRVLLRALDEDLSLGRLLGARLAGLAVGSITPGAKLGGEPLRAYMLARDGVRAGPAIASVVVDRGIELAANVVFGVGYCALFAAADSTTAGRVGLVIAASGLALVSGIAVALSRLRRGDSLVPARFLPVLERLGASRAAVAETDVALHRLLFARRRLLVWVFAAALGLNLLIFAEYAALFAAFAAAPSAAELAGTLLGVGLAHALPVPAALGALEGAQAVVMRIAGGGAHLALVAAAVARLRDLAWTLPGVVYLGCWTVRRSRRRGPGRRGSAPPATAAGSW